MKKIFLISAILIFSTAFKHAQSVKYGITGGLNHANEIGTNIIVDGKNYKTDAIISYHAGLAAQIELFKGVAFQPELLYSTQGVTYTNSIEDIKNELNYIAILKIDINKIFSLELEPQASFLLSKKNDFDAKDSTTFDFSVVGGLGLKITKNFFLQAKYGLGLTEMSKNT